MRAVRHRKEYGQGERMVYGYTYSPGPGDKAREAQQVTCFFVYSHGINKLIIASKVSLKLCFRSSDCMFNLFVKLGVKQFGVY